MCISWELWEEAISELHYTCHVSCVLTSTWIRECRPASVHEASTASDALHCTALCRLFRDIHCSIRQKNIHTFCGSAIRVDKSHTYCTCCIPTPYTHARRDGVAGGYRHTLFLHIPCIRSVFKTLARPAARREMRSQESNKRKININIWTGW